MEGLEPGALAAADQEFATARAAIEKGVDTMAQLLDKHNGDPIKTYAESVPAALLGCQIGGPVSAAGTITMLLVMLAQHRRATRDGDR